MIIERSGITRGSSLEEFSAKTGRRRRKRPWLNQPRSTRHWISSTKTHSASRHCDRKFGEKQEVFACHAPLMWHCRVVLKIVFVQQKLHWLCSSSSTWAEVGLHLLPTRLVFNLCTLYNVCGVYSVHRVYSVGEYVHWCREGRSLTCEY